MDYSNRVRYVGWGVTACLIIIGIGAANTYQELGLASTWITWAILVQLIFQNYRLKLAVDDLNAAS